MNVKYITIILTLFSTLAFSQTSPYELHKELGFSISKSERYSITFFKTY